MRVYVDATTLISLGSIDELDLLRNFDGEVTILPAVQQEVTTEPAKANLDAFLSTGDVLDNDAACEDYLEQARDVLNETDDNGDVWIIAGVLARDDVAVVSDDRRVRTVAEGLGATVTGTVGVVVRAVDEGMSSEEGKETVRRIDKHGLHMTAELREKAYELIDRRSD